MILFCPQRILLAGFFRPGRAIQQKPHWLFFAIVTSLIPSV
jgi:hypothetical protein